MIWIFIKWLRNARTLATRVYEKGPKSLADAIREVEKLQAAQQLTATLLPSSHSKTSCQVTMTNVSSVKNQGTWHATVPI